MLIFTLNQIYRLVKWSPVVVVGAFLILNHFHFSFVVSIAVLSEWKSITLGQMQTAGYFVGLIAALLLSALGKIILVRQFHNYFHGQLFKKCIWCNEENNHQQENTNILTSFKIFKQNFIFTCLIFLIVLTVWLPIIAHHLWVDSKFENIAFLLSLSLAVIVSVFSGVAELVFAYSTAVYKLSWTNSVLLTFNLLVLKWQQIAFHILNTNIWYGVVSCIIILSLQQFNNHALIFSLLLILAPVFQVFWVVKLHQLIIVVRAEGLINKTNPSISAINT